MTTSFTYFGLTFIEIQGLDEDLHVIMETQHQMQVARLLDVVVRQHDDIELLDGRQALLIR